MKNYSTAQKIKPYLNKVGVSGEVVTILIKNCLNACDIIPAMELAVKQIFGQHQTVLHFSFFPSKCDILDAVSSLETCPSS